MCFKDICKWMSGYSDLPAFSMREPLRIPPEATHVLKITGKDSILKARRFHDTYRFETVYMHVFYVPYSVQTDKIFDTTLSKYYGIELAEFLHYIIPSQNVIIEYLPVNSFIYDDNTPDRTRILELTGDCDCTNNTSNCTFHDFLCESLNIKYKNDVVTETPNCDSVYDDIGSLDQFVP